MFPQHLQTIFLTVLSLIMGGNVLWPVAQLESREQGATDWELSDSAVTAVPVTSSTSTPETPSDPLLEGESALQTLQTPGVYHNTKPQAPTTEYHPASLKYLTEIGFGVEYGESVQVLHKWTDNVRIKVHGTPTRADMDTLGQVIAELNELLADVGLQLVDEDANLEIYFLPESQFTAVEPEYVPVNLGFFRVWWDGTGAINRAKILIASQGVTQRERSHLIREELTQSLGLFRDSWQYPDSVFYQGWTDTTSYSALDQATINLLYSPQLKPGMTENEVLQALAAPSIVPCCRD